MNFKEIKKKSEMDAKTTYFLCPDKSCKEFFETTRSTCEEDCPYQDKQKKLILCERCEEMIILPGDHFDCDRVDHNCPDGEKHMNFHRMNGYSRLVYEMPK